MRVIRRVVTSAGLLVLALLPAAAAVSPDRAAADRVPIALAQPALSWQSTPLAKPAIGLSTTTLPSEPGLLVLVGGSLLALAAVVRRTGGTS